MKNVLKDMTAELADLAERTASFVNVLAEETAVLADKVVDALDEASDSISGWAVTMRAEAKDEPVGAGDNVSWADFTDKTEPKTQHQTNVDAVNKAKQFIEENTGKTFEEVWAEIQKGWKK